MARCAHKSKRQSKREARREGKRHRSAGNVTEISPDVMPARADWTHPRQLECQTEAQYQYLNLMQTKQLTFGTGPAGTGKSFVATSHACQQLIDRRVSKIIITRPAVSTDEMGYLPGEIDEKFAPYFEPLRRIFLEWFGASHLDLMLKRGTIEIAPLAYMRGLTFDNAFVIMDEAQNATPQQMKLFLTRIGKYSTVVVNGDDDQKDIRGLSGLTDAVTRLERLDSVGHLAFTEDDVVRSGLVRDILRCYRSVD